MSEDIWTILARLRRAQPRNPDTMAVCDALEQALHIALKSLGAVAPKQDRFDRTAYMRDYMRTYMRRRRAKLKSTMDGDPT